MLAMTSLPVRNKSSTNIDSEITVDIVQEQQTTVNSTSATDAALLKETSIKLAANYYLSQKSGFVIQIAAFDDIELANDYMMSLAKINSHVYQRLLNNNTNFVITSAIYADKLSAKQALLALPESIIARQPWIKSLKLVKREINAFQDSQ
jgi:DamX protein